MHLSASVEFPNPGHETSSLIGNKTVLTIEVSCSFSLDVIVPRKGSMFMNRFVYIGTAEYRLFPKVTL